MLEEDSKFCHITALPTEILLSIFTYLTARDLIKCRQVCIRWKSVVDGLQKSELLWREHCRRDYPEVYKTARYKSRVGFLWYNIYKSLSLWPKLASARELRDEFAPASAITEEIMNFQVLQNGIIGVHRKGSICYYDLETLEPSRRSPITGNYLLYSENTDTIIILAFQLHLHVIRKVLHTALHTNNTSYLNVKTFLLQEREVYYANLEDEVYVINLDDETLSSKFIRRFHENIMCIGYSKKCLNVLTFEKNIYSINDSDIVSTHSLDSANNLLHTLKEYHFLENLDWRVYFQWMYVLQHTIPHGPLRDIIVVRIYGDIVFVGSNWGVLRIYYAPYSSGEFDLYSAEPVKQYNFMERQDCPVLSDLCPVIQIDVLESEDGHTVLAAMPKKIAVIEFVHNFKRTASFAMLPYRDMQRIKILKIDDSV